MPWHAFSVPAVAVFPLTDVLISHEPIAPIGLLLYLQLWKGDLHYCPSMVMRITIILEIEEIIPRFICFFSPRLCCSNIASRMNESDWSTSLADWFKESFAWSLGFVFGTVFVVSNWGFDCWKLCGRGKSVGLLCETWAPLLVLICACCTSSSLLISKGRAGLKTAGATYSFDLIENETGAEIAKRHYYPHYSFCYGSYITVHDALT